MTKIYHEVTIGKRKSQTIKQYQWGIVEYRLVRLRLLKCLHDSMDKYIAKRF